MRNKPNKADLDELILIGVVVKSHGVKGEVKVKPLTDNPSRFLSLKKALLKRKDEEPYPINIQYAKLLGRNVVLKFGKVNSTSEAKEIVGSEIIIPREECEELPPDSYYVFDLVGLQVVLSHGEPIGKVADAQSEKAQDLLVIEMNDGREVLVPFVKEIVTHVSLEEKKIVVENIPGLFFEEGL